MLAHYGDRVLDGAGLLVLSHTDGYNDLLQHARRDNAILLLLHDDAAIAHRLNRNAVGQLVLILDRHGHLID